mgnify:CR=1 FL=1
MVLLPFRRRATQRLFADFFIILGIILMLSTPIIKLNQNIQISGFVTGAILGFLGLFYLLDIQ